MGRFGSFGSFRIFGTTNAKMKENGKIIWKILLWEAFFIYLLCPTLHKSAIVIQNPLQSTIFVVPAIFGRSLNGYHDRHGAIKTHNNQRIDPLDDNGSRGVCGSDGFGDEMGFHLRLADLGLKQA